MRMTTTQDRDITERTVPLILIGAGVLLILVQAIVSPGDLGVLGMFGARMVSIIIGSVFALLACYATAAVFNISFGLLKPAMLKLVGIYAVTSAAFGLVGSLPGFVLTILMYTSLLSWLFDLEAYQVVIFIVMLFGVQMGMVLFAGLIG